ncbi:MAG: class I SAM-dependent methyltransferase [Patescibacteria group bacterium]
MKERDIRDFWLNFSPETTPATTPIDKNFWSYFSPGDKILEVGSAWGRVIYECLARNLAVTGIDINSAEVANLQRKLKDEGQLDTVGLVLASATELPFPSQAFEGLFLQGLLSALPKDERLASLREAQRVLKTNGHIHIAEFELNQNDQNAIERYKSDFEVTGEYGTVSVLNGGGRELFRSHNFRREELIDLVESANLDVIDVQEKIFPTFKLKEKPGIILTAQKSKIWQTK